MLVSEFDYALPAELIAQAPSERGSARMLVLERATGRIRHAHVGALPEFLAPGDLVVVNNTRVFPARLRGHRVPSGGAVQCLLLHRLDRERWDALVHPGQKLGPGARMRFGGAGGLLEAEVLERTFHGRRVIRLLAPEGGDIETIIDRIGHVPLPPYIKRADTPFDRERYQTVFASRRGSVAAPTAGLHFTPDLVRALETTGIGRAEITLHVGYGTFKPVRVEQAEDHVVDAEAFEIAAAAARAIDRTLAAGRRVVAVGTTTTRALESADVGRPAGARPATGVTDLVIVPGFRFGVVGALLTNFHLPRSSLLMLVCAFGGTERVLAAYREAVDRRYRFYSYGDCMLIT